MQDNIVKPCELVQYADDTSIFGSCKKFEDVIQFLEKNIGDSVEYFDSHRLNLNHQLSLSFLAGRQ